MSRFVFNLATPKDDAQLRHVLAGTPMEGPVSIAFAREPCYFEATAVDGDSVQVVTVTDNKTGQVIGMGSRAIRKTFVNSQQTQVGYLSALRLLKPYRGQGRLLARGYQFLRSLHQDQKVSYYLTTIADDNKAAINLLTSGRAGLPIYHPIGKYYTLPMNSSSIIKTSYQRQSKITVRQATINDRENILAFINDHGSTRQFFPAYQSTDLFTEKGTLKGLQPEDVFLAFQDGHLIGTLGLWDQSGFKQTIIKGYSNWTRLARPIYNEFARIRNRPILPKIGSTVNARYVTIPAVTGNNPRVFQQLIQVAVQTVAGQNNLLLLMGLHESDPLLPLALKMDRTQIHHKVVFSLLERRSD